MINVCEMEICPAFLSLYTKLTSQIKYKVTPFINQSTTLKIAWLYGYMGYVNLVLSPEKPINQESPPPLLVNCCVIFPIEYYLSF